MINFKNMETLENKLNNLNNNLDEWEKKNYKIIRIEKFIDKTEYFGKLFIVFIFTIIFISLHHITPFKLIYKLIFDKLQEYPVFGFFLLIFGFYALVALWAFIAILVIEIIPYFIFPLFGLGYTNYKKEINKRFEFKNEIQKTILQIEKEKRDYEFNNRWTIELNHLLKLNSLIDSLLKKNKPLHEIEIELNELKNEINRLNTKGLLSKSLKFYNNKFELINNLIKNNENSYKKNKEMKKKSNEEKNANSNSIHNDEKNTNNESLPIPINNNIINTTEIKVTESTTNSANHFPIEKPIKELFNNKKANSELKINSKEKKLPKIDFNKKQQTNKQTGEAGEFFAIQWEKNKLEREGMIEFIDRVIQVSINTDSLGYDILSFNKDGSKKYIEVKTTTDNFNSPFYLTETEIIAMNKYDNYYIYRIYNFDSESKNGKLFIINCKNDMEKYYKMRPVSFKVTPK
jgi:hypothetical protein